MENTNNIIWGKWCQPCQNPTSSPLSPTILHLPSALVPVSYSRSSLVFMQWFVDNLLSNSITHILIMLVSYDFSEQSLEFQWLLVGRSCELLHTSSLGYVNHVKFWTLNWLTWFGIISLGLGRAIRCPNRQCLSQSKYLQEHYFKSWQRSWVLSCRRTRTVLQSRKTWAFDYISHWFCMYWTPISLTKTKVVNCSRNMIKWSWRKKKRSTWKYGRIYQEQI